MATIHNSNMVHRLQAEDREIFVVGTAHVSQESVRLVAELIAQERPDTVCVELCESRYQSIHNKDAWQNMDIVKVVREKKAFLLLSNLLLASFQKRLAKKFDIRPGQEMIEAITSAEALGAEICLADRDIRITLSRTWRTMRLWDKIKLFFQLILSFGQVEEISEADVERMKQEDVLTTLLSDVGKSLPVIREILIDERDRYLAYKIRQAPGNKVIAVVGAGHVPGIKKYWEKDIDVGSLEKLPAKRKILGALKWIIPAGIIGLILTGFHYGGTQTGANMVAYWLLVNGVLAGIGALIALAHPLTILSSVLAAPLTSLNPMIAAGWVSGLVEAFSRKPKVIDFENLQEDIHSLRGFWRNKITRILLVVVFTNVGSSLGTFVAIPLMVKVL
jgi:pheromone shutdown-related protein TraB